MSARVTKRAIAILGVVALFGWVACAASNSSVCDPFTIEVEGKCFWDQPSACDAALCNKPDVCTIAEGKPAHIECKRHTPEK